MFNKQQLFYIFNTLIVVFILVIHYVLIDFFNQFSFWSLLIFTTLSCSILYFILSKIFIEDIFKIDNKLQEKIEKSMHEINTPVATIKINTEILQSKTNDDKSLQRLDRINKACDNLLELYEDMEYYIKREIDNIEISSFHLKELLDISIEKFEDLKNDIHIHLDLDVENTTITTDKNGFEALINNLISNSIKHNNNISHINISLKDTTLIFADNGEGISTQDVYNVFNKYFQANENSKGFGIGLNLVKEFCDEQKLDIKIDSSKDGTTFYINLRNILKEDI